MKPILVLGDALEAIRDFPSDVRREAGHQLDRVQRGLMPDDWKPLTILGAGISEIRLRDANGAFRVIYIAKSDKAGVACFPKEDGKNGYSGFGFGEEAVAGLSETSMAEQTFVSVWDALEDSPEMAENMKIRSALMIELQELVRSRGWAQEEAAGHLGVTQPRLNDWLMYPQSATYER
jgi:phage-related protein/predicted XRE-type DNA-binding protein